jgi:hypothetical protein
VTPRIPPLTESLDGVAARITDGTLVLKATLGHRIVGTAGGRLVGDTGHIGYTEFKRRPDSVGVPLVYLEKTVA